MSKIEDKSGRIDIIDDGHGLVEAMHGSIESMTEGGERGPAEAAITPDYDRG